MNRRLLTLLLILSYMNGWVAHCVCLTDGITKFWPFGFRSEVPGNVPFKAVKHLFQSKKKNLLDGSPLTGTTCVWIVFLHSLPRQTSAFINIPVVLNSFSWCVHCVSRWGEWGVIMIIKVIASIASGCLVFHPFIISSMDWNSRLNLKLSTKLLWCSKQCGRQIKCTKKKRYQYNMWHSHVKLFLNSWQCELAC